MDRIPYLHFSYFVLFSAFYEKEYPPPYVSIMYSFQVVCKLIVVVVVVELLFYDHGKHPRSCRDGQLTEPHFSWAGLDLLSG